jgi:D-glycero-alpha-D-manno-heptose-7-phosphate kinase
MGGCGRYVIGPYPEVRHHPVHVPAEAVDALSDRLVTVVLGAHDSSAVHHEVIHLLTACGGPEHDRARDALRRMAALAADAANALREGDVDRWARVLCEATEQQERLLPALVGPGHHLAIELARSVGAVGWKVNGAGGDGGSVTFVAADGDGADAIRSVLSSADQGWTLVDLRLSAGLTVRSA